MLEALRARTTGIVAKIFIGLLILSFAVWGIGDMITGFNRTTVASVGGTPISTSEFQQAYQREIDMFSRQFGRRLTPAEAKAFGVEQQVVARLTGAAALDNHVQELKLSIRDKTVENEIRKDPAFTTTGGTFDRTRFEDVLRQLGFSEQQYFEARTKEAVRDQLTDSMLSNVLPTNALIDLYRTYQLEQRVAKYVTLDPKRDVKVGEPTDADLKKTYDDNKRRFVTPEYRKAQILKITGETARKKLPITDDEIKQRYEGNKEAYAIPEERNIQQIPFKDEAAAEAARKEILAGKDFVEVAKANGAKETDINLGVLRKSQMIDKAIADAAFALEKDKVSEVIKGQLTTVLLRVTDIKPGKQRTFDEVKDEIRFSIASSRAPEKIQELQNQVDDNRLAGKSLKDIAHLLDVPFADVESMDAEGKTTDGKPAFDSPDLAILARAVFSAEVGVEKEVIELSDGGYAWVTLVSVTPEKEKPYDAVKDEVRKTWTDIETARLLREKADALVKSAEQGKSLEAIAKELGAEVQTTPEFRRGDSLPEFSQAAVTRAFTVPPGVPANSTTARDASRLILEVTKVIPPPPIEKQQRERVEAEVAQELRRDIVAQYVANLQSRMGVEINQRLIDITTGAEALQR